MSNIKTKKTIEAKKSFKDDVKSYFKGVKLEWGKITWPERRQVMLETIIVLVIVFFFTALIFVIDKIYALMFSLLGKL